MTDLWPLTFAARHSLLATFEQLNDEQFDTPSLCEGWRVRDVLAHLILAHRPPPGRYAKEMARARGNFDRANDVMARADGERPTGEVAAYDAPFPDDTYKAGARIFPSLVPTSPDDPAADANRAAWEVFKEWDKPLICCFSDRDPVTAGGDKPFLQLVPGAAGQPHTTIEGAHHFFQEDAGPELAQLVIAAVSAS